MVVEITKETWAKYSIQTLIYHNQEEKKKNELWHKMSHIETQLEHSNIADIVLKRTRKYCGKKTKKKNTEKEKQKYSIAYFKGEVGVFITEKLARDIIEGCKLPEAIELGKKLGYNHNNIMV